MSDQENPWKLPDHVNKEIYQDIILPRALEGVTRPEQPRVIFIGGQAASSKTTAQRTALARLGDEGGIIADFDALLTDHPHYASLMAENDRTASQLAGGDAYVWMHNLIQHAKDEQLNLIREGSMGGRSPEREATEFRSRGFGTEADVMAVPAAISRTANLHRYQQMRETALYGRLVATEIHDSAYNGIPRTLASLERNKSLDAIRLHRWGGGLVYENSLDAQGEWTRPANARAALEQERLRPLSPEQAQWLQERHAYLGRHLPMELRGQLQEIAGLAQQVGVQLGDGAPRSIAAAANLHRSAGQGARGGPASGTPGAGPTTGPSAPRAATDPGAAPPRVAHQPPANPHRSR